MTLATLGEIVPGCAPYPQMSIRLVPPSSQDGAESGCRVGDKLTGDCRVDPLGSERSLEEWRVQVAE